MDVKITNIDPADVNKTLKMGTQARIAFGVITHLPPAQLFDPASGMNATCAFCLGECRCRKIRKGTTVRYREPKNESERNAIFVVLESHDERGQMPRISVRQLLMQDGRIDDSLVGQASTRLPIEDFVVANPFTLDGYHCHVRGEQMHEGSIAGCQLCVHDARALGRHAFARGVACVPHFDMANLSPLLKRRQVGEGIPILEAWINGWTVANLEAPTDES